MRIIKLVFIIGLAMLVGACATSKSGEVFSRKEARQVQTVDKGKILAVKPVTVEGTQSGVGTVGGGVIGGIAGSTIGGGRGQAIAATVGAIAGGVLGSAIEEGTTRQSAMQITVELEDGRTIALVQSVGNEPPFEVGESVKVLSTVHETRVTR